MTKRIHNFNDFNGNTVSSTWAIEAGLNAVGNKLSLVANNTDSVTVHYAGSEPAPHVWNVNGQNVSLTGADVTPAPGIGWQSELTIKTPAAGPIDVEIFAQTLTLTAT